MDYCTDMKNNQELESVQIVKRKVTPFLNTIK